MNSLFSLFSHHDVLNIHKILGFGCLAHYGYRFSNKLLYGSMFFESSNSNSISTYISPLVHLTLSMSSFIFSVPTHRFNSKAIIWRELQLHNIIFSSRSVCMMYHALFFKELNALYYFSRLGIVLFHHYLADLVTIKYQKDNKTTTRDIPYDTKNTLIPYLNKKFYAMSQLFATSTILLSDNCENGFSIMFPIQLSTFLMTLVRKNIIGNNTWHILYAMSLCVPYILNRNSINNGNDKFFPSVIYAFCRLFLGFDKYINMSFLTYYYINIKHINQIFSSNILNIKNN
jgi:hypothetical protein